MDTEPAVRDETVTLDGLRFHYRDWGDPRAPAVVLLHAYLQHARTWDTVAKGLADRFRVLALDQRGLGESQWATDYHELRLVADVAQFGDALARIIHGGDDRRPTAARAAVQGGSRRAVAGRDLGIARPDHRS
jgi:pimeloyl-ACP methyl ester carboxylesterase